VSDRNDDFAGKVAWVAGAARPPGMGRSVAVQLARRGADVACVDVVVPEPATDQAYEVSREALETTADAVRAEGRRALVLPVDLTDADSVDESVRATVAEFGRIDVCANLSGGTGPRLGTSRPTTGTARSTPTSARCSSGPAPAPVR
jgi:NAD(P)-dependent dehydrogenase (short-subunit alcohol dehydrogenase family)